MDDTTSTYDMHPDTPLSENVPVLDFNAFSNATDAINSSCGDCSTEAGMNLQAELHMNVIYTLIGVVGIVGNALVVCVLLYNRNLRKSLTNMFIINQSVIDATASAFIILSAFVREGRQLSDSPLHQELFCRLWLTNLPMWGLFVSSTYNIVAVTFERFSALVYPFSHQKYFTRRRALVIICCAWVSGPAYNASYMIATAGMLPNGECTVYSVYPSQEARLAVGVITVFLQYIIPLGLVIYAYTRIAIVLSRAGKRRGSQPEATRCHKREARLSTAKRNVIKTLALVSASFVFCWSWNQIYYIMYNCGYEVNFNSSFYHFTVVMVFCNCCVNPFVYAAQFKQFQQGFLNMMCEKKKESSYDSSTQNYKVSASQEGKNTTTEENGKNKTTEERGKNTATDENGKNKTTEENGTNTTTEENGTNTTTKDNGSNITAEENGKNRATDESEKNTTTGDNGTKMHKSVYVISAADMNERNSELQANGSSSRSMLPQYSIKTHL